MPFVPFRGLSRILAIATCFYLFIISGAESPAFLARFFPFFLPPPPTSPSETPFFQIQPFRICALPTSFWDFLCPLSDIPRQVVCYVVCWTAPTTQKTCKKINLCAGFAPANTTLGFKFLSSPQLTRWGIPSVQLLASESSGQLVCSRQRRGTQEKKQE